MDAGLIKGEGFAIDASVMEADASRYHGKAPGEIDWSLSGRQTRAAAEFLGGLEDEDPDANRELPKAISPSDPCSAWTAKANKRVQFCCNANARLQGRVGLQSTYRSDLQPGTHRPLCVVLFAMKPPRRPTVSATHF
jgi:hypothetical protein